MSRQKRTSIPVLKGSNVTKRDVDDPIKDSVATEGYEPTKGTKTGETPERSPGEKKVRRRLVRKVKKHKKAIVGLTPETFDSQLQTESSEQSRNQYNESPSNIAEYESPSSPDKDLNGAIPSPIIAVKGKRTRISLQSSPTRHSSQSDNSYSQKEADTVQLGEKKRVSKSLVFKPRNHFVSSESEAEDDPGNSQNQGKTTLRIIQSGTDDDGEITGNKKGLVISATSIKRPNSNYEAEYQQDIHRRSPQNSQQQKVQNTTKKVKRYSQQEEPQENNNQQSDFDLRFSTFPRVLKKGRNRDSIRKENIKQRRNDVRHINQEQQDSRQIQQPRYRGLSPENKQKDVQHLNQGEHNLRQQHRGRDSSRREQRKDVRQINQKQQELGQIQQQRSYDSSLKEQQQNVRQASQEEQDLRQIQQLRAGKWFQAQKRSAEDQQLEEFVLNSLSRSTKNSRRSSNTSNQILARSDVDDGSSVTSVTYRSSQSSVNDPIKAKIPRQRRSCTLDGIHFDTDSSTDGGSLLRRRPRSSRRRSNPNLILGRTEINYPKKLRPKTIAIEQFSSDRSLSLPRSSKRPIIKSAFYESDLPVTDTEDIGSFSLQRSSSLPRSSKRPVIKSAVYDSELAVTDTEDFGVHRTRTLPHKKKKRVQYEDNTRTRKEFEDFVQEQRKILLQQIHQRQGNQPNQQQTHQSQHKQSTFVSQGSQVEGQLEDTVKLQQAYQSQSQQFQSQISQEQHLHQQLQQQQQQKQQKRQSQRENLEEQHLRQQEHRKQVQQQQHFSQQQQQQESQTQIINKQQQQQYLSQNREQQFLQQQQQQSQEKLVSREQQLWNKQQQQQQQQVKSPRQYQQQQHEFQGQIGIREQQIWLQKQQQQQQQEQKERSQQQQYQSERKVVSKDQQQQQQPQIKQGSKEQQFFQQEQQPLTEQQQQQQAFGRSTNNTQPFIHHQQSHSQFIRHHQQQQLQQQQQQQHNQQHNHQQSHKQSNLVGQSSQVEGQTEDTSKLQHQRSHNQFIQQQLQQHQQQDYLQTQQQQNTFQQKQQQQYHNQKQEQQQQYKKQLIQQQQHQQQHHKYNHNQNQSENYQSYNQNFGQQQYSQRKEQQQQHYYQQQFGQTQSQTQNQFIDQQQYHHTHQQLSLQPQQLSLQPQQLFKPVEQPQQEINQRDLTSDEKQTGKDVTTKTTQNSKRLSIKEQEDQIEEALRQRQRQLVQEQESNKKQSESVSQSETEDESSRKFRFGRKKKKNRQSTGSQSGTDLDTEGFVSQSETEESNRKFRFGVKKKKSKKVIDNKQTSQQNKEYTGSQSDTDNNKTQDLNQDEEFVKKSQSSKVEGQIEDTGKQQSPTQSTNLRRSKSLPRQTRKNLTYKEEEDYCNFDAFIKKQRQILLNQLDHKEVKAPESNQVKGHHPETRDESYLERYHESKNPRRLNLKETTRRSKSTNDTQAILAAQKAYIEDNNLVLQNGEEVKPYQELDRQVSEDNNIVRVFARGGVIQLSMEPEFEFDQEEENMNGQQNYYNGYRQTHVSKSSTEKQRVDRTNTNFQEFNRHQDSYYDQGISFQSSDGQRNFYQQRVNYGSPDRKSQHGRGHRLNQVTKVTEAQARGPPEIMYYTICTHYFRPEDHDLTVNLHRHGRIKVPGGLSHDDTCIFYNHLYVYDEEEVILEKVAPIEPTTPTITTEQYNFEESMFDELSSDDQSRSSSYTSTQYMTTDVSRSSSLNRKDRNYYASLKREKGYNLMANQDPNNNEMFDYERAFDSTYETLRRKRRSTNSLSESEMYQNESVRSVSPTSSSGRSDSAFSYSKPRLLRKSDKLRGIGHEVEDDYPKWRPKSPIQPDRTYGFSVTMGQQQEKSNIGETENRTSN